MAKDIKIFGVSILGVIGIWLLFSAASRFNAFFDTLINSVLEPVLQNFGIVNSSSQQLAIITLLLIAAGLLGVGIFEVVKKLSGN